jgi:Family of unknown function (DUF5989)
MFDLLKDLLRFMTERKKLWLMPLIIAILAFGTLIVVAEYSAAIAPLIYTLF